MKAKLLVFLILLTSYSHAQDEVNSTAKSIPTDYNYTWETEFDQIKYASVGHRTKEATILFHRTIFATTLPKVVFSLESIPQRKIEHTIYWIQEESAIEKMNEVYLYEGVGAVSDLKIRTINKQGTVVEFDESKLEEVSKDDGETNYKILAIPGIEKESWVEILIVYDGFPNENRVMIREPFDVVEAEVIYNTGVLSTSNAGWVPQPKIKYYNGFIMDYMIAKLDVFDDRPRNTVYRAANIPAQINDESYVHEYADCPRVDIMMHSALYRNISFGVHENYFGSNALLLRGGAMKTLAGIGADVGDDKSRLQALETYIKEEINLTDDQSDNFAMPTYIIKHKIANEQGKLRLFYHLLRYLEIDYQIFLVADKEYLSPHEDLPSTLGLSDFLFYFPASKMYCHPLNKYYRVSTHIPNFLAGADAIELVNPSPANIASEEYNKYDFYSSIPNAKRENNVDATYARVEFDPEGVICTIDKTKIYFGDRAVVERGSMNFMNETEKSEQIKDALVSKLENANLSDISTDKLAISYNSNPQDSMKYRGKIETSDMITQVGDGFLLNLSKVIGNQVSYYDEGERVHSIFSRASKVYDHTIEFVIPEGYEVKGIENLVFDRNYYSVIEGDLVHNSSFVSTAEIVDGVLIVKVHEFYEEGLFPKDQIEVFKSVVNGAYEFYIAQIKLVKI